MPNSGVQTLTSDGAPLLWESGGWDDPWLAYLGEGTITFEHALGRRPAEVTLYMSFSPLGVNPGAAAGDLARIVSVDRERVTLWNHSNNALFVRLVLQ